MTPTSSAHSSPTSSPDHRARFPGTGEDGDTSFSSTTLSSSVDHEEGEEGLDDQDDSFHGSDQSWNLVVADSSREGERYHRTLHDDGRTDQGSKAEPDHHHPHHHQRSSSDDLENFHQRSRRSETGGHDDDDDDMENPYLGSTTTTSPSSNRRPTKEKGGKGGLGLVGTVLGGLVGGIGGRIKG